MSVRVALVKDSPWPEMNDEPCMNGQDIHPARWVVWTDEDTGDGMRFACDEHLAGWVMAVAARIMNGVFQ